MSYQKTPFATIQNRFLLFFLILACQGCEVYDDNYQVEMPPPIIYERAYPGLAVIEFTQSAEESSSVPSMNTQLRMKVTKLDERISGNFAILVKLYNQIPLRNANLGLIKIVRIAEFQSVNEATIDLGTSYKVPLRNELVEVYILDNGIDDDNQNLSRGYYIGTYALVQDEDTVLAGNVSGTVDYEGIVKFEMKGVDAFHFITGQSVDSRAGLNVYGDVRKTDETAYSLFHTRLQRQDTVLLGPIPLNSSEYDTLQINVVRRVF